MMRPHNGRIDHLHAARRTRALGIAALVQGLQHQLPYPRQRPAPELPVHRRPFAEILVQVAPRRARPRDPEHPVQNKPVIFRRSTALAAPGNHERREKRPLLVRHQSTNQDRLPKSSLESRLAPFVNPLCQRVLDRWLGARGVIAVAGPLVEAVHTNIPFYEVFDGPAGANDKRSLVTDCLSAGMRQDGIIDFIHARMEHAHAMLCNERMLGAINALASHVVKCRARVDGRTAISVIKKALQ